jgi:DNA-binding transcriptional MerR regulator
MRTVSEVSKLTGVTVRTLHHYDEIGLLVPGERSEAGYRLYSAEDLLRLQEILLWRQLGFSLAEVKSVLDDPEHDRGSALREQRRLVAEQIERLGALAGALDAALAAHTYGTDIEEAAMFDGFDPQAYEEEARERWGEGARCAAGGRGGTAGRRGPRRGRASPPAHLALVLRVLASGACAPG